MIIFRFSSLHLQVDWVYENNRLRPAKDSSNLNQTEPTCLTKGSVGPKVSILPCDTGYTSQNVKVIVDPSVKTGNVYNFKFSGNKCLTYIDSLFTLPCKTGDKSQQFTPKNIQELIKVIFTNKTHHHPKAVISINRSNTNLLQAFTREIPINTSQTLTMADFNSYGHSTTKEISSPSQSFSSINIDDENLRAGDTLLATIENNRISLEKIAAYSPVLIDTQNYKSMMVSVSQPFFSFFPGNQNLFVVNEDKDLIMAYEKPFYQGNAWLEYFTNYKGDRNKTIQSFKVLQTSIPNSSIRLQTDITRASQGEYLTYKPSTANRNIENHTSTRLESIKKMFVGTRNKNIKESCPGGRILTVVEVKTDKSWCVAGKTEQYGIYKVTGNDNSLWQATGRGHDCDVKLYGNLTSESLCTTAPLVTFDDPLLFSISNNGIRNDAGPFNTYLYKGKWKPGLIFRDHSAKSLKLYILLTGEEAKNTALTDLAHWMPLNVKRWQQYESGVQGEIYEYKNQHKNDQYIELWRLKNTGRYSYFPTNRISNSQWEYLGKVEIAR